MNYFSFLFHFNLCFILKIFLIFFIVVKEIGNSRYPAFVLPEKKYIKIGYFFLELFSILNYYMKKSFILSFLYIFHTYTSYINKLK